MLKTMTKSFITTLLMLFALSLPQQLNAELYKWTDELGRIHFTDTPPEGAKAKPIDIGPLNTYDSPSESSIKDTLSRPTGVTARKPKVILYSTTWCGYCKKVRKWLRQKKIAFSEYDTEKSERGRRDYKKMNGRGVPIVKVGKQRVNGFSPGRLTQLLRKAGYQI